MSSLLKKLLSIVFVVVVFGATFLAWTQRQTIYDWVKLQGYDAPDDVVQLADVTTMTHQGRKIFYVNRPQILEDKAEFSNACEQTEESIVLGCYSGNKGIYLYRVKDSRLDGVLQVTAAHEMLHAAYERLSHNEQKRIDELINQAYETVTNPRVKESVDRYRKRDPAVVPTELHSILATEVAGLPAQLEDYYKQYFSNRATIVEFSEKYESEFANRQAKVSALDRQLTEQKNIIDAEQAALAAIASDLKIQRQVLDSFSSNDTVAYNRAASAYNKKVAAYNVQARQLQTKIEEYNKLVKERNKLAVEVQNLVEAIDSRPEEID